MMMMIRKLSEILKNTNNPTKLGKQFMIKIRNLAKHWWAFGLVLKIAV